MFMSGPTLMSNAPRSLGVDGLGDAEAVEGGETDDGALTALQAVDAEDVALGAKAAEFILETVEFVEHRVCRLRGVGLIRVGLRNEGLELGVHRLVDEAEERGRVGHDRSGGSTGRGLLRAKFFAQVLFDQDREQHTGPEIAGFIGFDR